MKCRKCKSELPDGSKFCLSCGAKQDVEQKPKSRGNGQGSVYKRPNGSWMAVKTIGYKFSPDGKKSQRITRTKSGFKTKKEALEHLAIMDSTPRPKKIPTLAQLYDTWLPTHKASKSTLDCYRSAWKWYNEISIMKVPDITIDDLQECIDECPRGRRTQENMKTLCGLLYKYAIPRNLVTINMGQYLKVSGEHGEKEGLPIDALEKIRKAAETSENAAYVLCQCYLGFRPSEFLSLRVSDYDAKERAFTGGAKTEAGKNRVVTVSPKIQKYIDKFTVGDPDKYVFGLSNGKAMLARDYRELFYQVLESCGIENPTTEVNEQKMHKYTPHSCRHTFASLMKRVDGADKDKLELIGHTSTGMLRHYQDVELDDLRKVTDAI